MGQSGHGGEPTGRYLLVLSLGALGVVYGDIGTSPLYALKECFHGGHGLPLSHDNVLGVLSLVFWALVIVVSVKYLLMVMRADNRGEGGILALMALVAPAKGGAAGRRPLLIVLGLFGAALLYGDGMITPAISVLSAVEGLEVVGHDALQPYVIPITLTILVGLFVVQRGGTDRVGRMFGPLMLIWFACLAALGLPWLVHRPEVLLAVLPTYAIRFMITNGWKGYIVLGSVFLVVTGGEALYADMGHFGRRPIRLAWFTIVATALLLNYFGQGAMLLGDPSAVRNPFYLLAPGWALWPLVLLSTVATSIASQAVISGAFSLTRQAVQLGYSPRVAIRHTSEKEIGQIYVPPVNWALLLAAVALVLGFKSSSNLASAYGIAVTTTMIITTVLLFVAMRRIWGWSLALALPICTFFAVIDLAFLGANLVKVLDGGWFPLAVGVGGYVLMSTWRKGRELLAVRVREATRPMKELRERIGRSPPPRVHGTAIFMTGNPEGVPLPLAHNLKHNKVLHDRIIFLTVDTQEVPRVPEEDRVEIEETGDGFFRVIASYGFMEGPDVAKIIKACRKKGLDIRMDDVTFFLGSETLLATSRPGMAIWREKLFAFLSRNAERPTNAFRIPPGRVVELGTQIEL